MNDDGTMARLPELMEFAKLHDLRTGTIADVIHYRAASETLVERVTSKTVSTAHGDFALHAYVDRASGATHLALVRGSIPAGAETLVRVHEPLSVLDFLDPSSKQQSFSIDQAQAALAKNGHGVIVLMHRPEDGEALITRLTGEKPRAQTKWDPRTYGIGAQILRDLGVSKMRLLSSPRKMPSKTGFGLEVTGLGESILRAHVDVHAAAGLAEGSLEAKEYVARHDHAVAWARVNRQVIAGRFAGALGAELVGLLDVSHNSVEALPGTPCCWLHRKGAAPSTQGPVVIPGSRGSLSYLVQPIAPADPGYAGYTLAHGAGRKWKRGDTKARLKDRYRPADLVQTALGSRVICEDRELLYEEAPEAYKDIDGVIAALLEAGLCRVVAVLRPVITYKTRRR